MPRHDKPMDISKPSVEGACMPDNTAISWHDFYQFYDNGRHILYLSPNPLPVNEQAGSFFKPSVDVVLKELDKEPAIRDKRMIGAVARLLPKEIQDAIKNLPHKSALPILHAYDPRLVCLTESQFMVLSSCLKPKPGRPPGKETETLEEYWRTNPQLMELINAGRRSQVIRQIARALYSHGWIKNIDKVRRFVNTRCPLNSPKVKSGLKSKKLKQNSHT
jgi:hypothetical protein